MYAPFPSNPQIFDVAEALDKKHPCLWGTWLIHRLSWLATKPSIQDGKLLHQTQRLWCPEICLLGLFHILRRTKVPATLPSRKGWGKSRTGEDLVANWSKEMRQQQIDQRENGQNPCTQKNWNCYPISQCKGHVSQMAGSVCGIKCQWYLYAK